MGIPQQSTQVIEEVGLPTLNTIGLFRSHSTFDTSAILYLIIYSWYKVGWVLDILKSTYSMLLSDRNM